MKNVRMLTFACVILGISVQAFGLPILDSSSFTHKYEGGSSFGSEYTFHGNSSYFSSDGDILTYDIPIGEGGGQYIKSNTWSAAGVQNTGYTSEVRLRISSDSPSTHYQFFMFQTSTDSCDDIRYFVAKGGIVRVPGSGSPVAVYIGDMTDDFHTIRVAHVGSDGSNPFPTSYDLWVDDVLISDSIDVTGSGAYNMMYWLGGTGDVAGGASIDYVRWDTGAYAPVPEPCTMVLLGSGVICFLRRKQ